MAPSGCNPRAEKRTRATTASSVSFGCASRRSRGRDTRVRTREAASRRRADAAPDAWRGGARAVSMVLARESRSLYSSDAPRRRHRRRARRRAR